MEAQKQEQQVLFKDLLVKTYEKGEKETNISTVDVVRDLAKELKQIIVKK